MSTARQKSTEQLANKIRSESYLINRSTEFSSKGNDCRCCISCSVGQRTDKSQMDKIELFTSSSASNTSDSMPCSAACSLVCIGRAFTILYAIYFRSDLIQSCPVTCSGDSVSAFRLDAETKNMFSLSRRTRMYTGQ